MNTTKQPTEQAVLEALAANPELTTAEIAAATGRARSTIGKSLAKLEKAGKVKHRVGGRDGTQRLPDRWSATGRRRSSRKGTSADQRLRPGQLDGLVLDHLMAHAHEGPLGSGAVAKALGRSSGAVGNCLARLAAAGHVRLTGEHPRRYELVADKPRRAPRGGQRMGA